MPRESGLSASPPFEVWEFEVWFTSPARVNASAAGFAVTPVNLTSGYAKLAATQVNSAVTPGRITAHSASLTAIQVSFTADKNPGLFYTLSQKVEIT